MGNVFINHTSRIFVFSEILNLAETTKESSKQIKTLKKKLKAALSKREKLEIRNRSSQTGALKQK